MNDSYARRGYADRGYDYDDRGYADPGYAEPGYADTGYADTGYADTGYADTGYAEPGYADTGYAELGYAEPRYDDPGTRSRGYDDRGYPERRRNSDRGFRNRRNFDGGYDDRENRKAREKRASTGGVILAVVSLLCTFLVIWGLYYATGTGERHKIALAAAGCEPNTISNNFPCVTVHVMNNQYKRLVNPAVQQVNTDVAAYTANETSNLTAAAAALRAEVTAEKGFVKGLDSFRFPAMVAPKVSALIAAIDAQAKLNAKQALSSSLAEMRSFNGRVDAASATVRADLTKVRKALETPVTANEEP